VRAPGWTPAARRGDGGGQDSGVCRARGPGPCHGRPGAGAGGFTRLLTLAAQVVGVAVYPHRAFLHTPFGGKIVGDDREGAGRVRRGD
jgi:hypothetical protein